jgi:hypothetical protein
LEESGKVGETASKLLINDAAVVRGAQVRLEEDVAVKVPLGKARISRKRGRLGKVTLPLYNIESCDEPERPLNVELGLYQMEEY